MVGEWMDGDAMDEADLVLLVDWQSFFGSCFVVFSCHLFRMGQKFIFRFRSSI